MNNLLRICGWCKTALNERTTSSPVPSQPNDPLPQANVIRALRTVRHVDCLISFKLLSKEICYMDM